MFVIRERFYAHPVFSKKYVSDNSVALFLLPPACSLNRLTWKKNLLTHLEYPVCMEYMRLPIVMCVNGHNICDICKQKVSNCPTCRNQFLKTRNLALEDLARQVMYPCKYRSNGCTEIFNRDKIVGHQAKCQYGPHVCPVAKPENGNCGWTGNYDVTGYLKENHLGKCCECV